MEKFLKFWGKWSWLIALLLLCYSVYKTFVPEYKIVTKTETVTVQDESLKKKVEEQGSVISRLQNDLKKAVAKNVDIEEIITETRYPDGRVVKVTERKKKDTSTSTTVSSTNQTVTSTTSVTSSVDSTSHMMTSSSTVTTQTQTRTFWTTMTGYQVKQKELILGQGINFHRNFTAGVLGSYKTNESENRWDYGMVLLMKY